MRNKTFPNYPDDADYTTNASSYYDDLARKEKLIRLLAERIWGYEEILNETLEEIQERFRAWDKILEDFPDDVKILLQQWLDDGTLDYIINDTIFNWKLDKSIFEQFRDSTTAQLEHMKIKVFNEMPTTTQLKEGQFGFVIDVAQQKYDDLNLSFENLNVNNFPNTFALSPTGSGVKTVETHLDDIMSTDGTYRSVKIGQKGGNDGSSNYSRIKSGVLIPLNGTRKVVKSDLTNFRFSVKPLSANCYDGSGFHMGSASVSLRGKNNEVLGNEVSNHFIYDKFSIPATATGNKVVLDEWSVVKWDLQEACRKQGIDFDLVNGVILTFNAYTNHSTASCEYLVDDISFGV